MYLALGEFSPRLPLAQMFQYTEQLSGERAVHLPVPGGAENYARNFLVPVVRHFREISPE